MRKVFALILIGVVVFAVFTECRQRDKETKKGKTAPRRQQKHQA